MGLLSASVAISVIVRCLLLFAGYPEPRPSLGVGRHEIPDLQGPYSGGCCLWMRGLLSPRARRPGPTRKPASPAISRQ